MLRISLIICHLRLAESPLCSSLFSPNQSNHCPTFVPTIVQCIIGINFVWQLYHLLDKHSTNSTPLFQDILIRTLTELAKLSTKCFAVVVRLAVEKLEKNVPPFTRLELFKDLTASPEIIKKKPQVANGVLFRHMYYMPNARK